MTKQRRSFTDLKRKAAGLEIKIMAISKLAAQSIVESALPRGLQDSEKKPIALLCRAKPYIWVIEKP
ncbi:hypothetical protein ACIQVE_12065 [Pseudomonas sp. NPDC098747]|uniref:hypothetical protein n=1 Tax=Pseudomonas sp. NPDC098747 TaxID=3364487 RepID=UPI00383B97E2